jgi:hypothetical protein
MLGSYSQTRTWATCGSAVRIADVHIRTFNESALHLFGIPQVARRRLVKFAPTRSDQRMCPNCHTHLKHASVFIATPALHLASHYGTLAWGAGTLLLVRPVTSTWLLPTALGTESFQIPNAIRDSFAMKRCRTESDWWSHREHD